MSQSNYDEFQNIVKGEGVQYFCPITKDTCKKDFCAWFDTYNKSCAVLAIIPEVIQISEAIRDGI